MLISGRNKKGLSEREIQNCLWAWELLSGPTHIELVTSEASQHNSRTRFSENKNVVYLGADVKPGNGIEANSRMSILACLAHELAHAQRFKSGFQRPIELPDVLIDEAETSLHASFMSVLGLKDREDLIEDARDRLNQWLSSPKGVNK
ncbi:hypothetical protein PN36_16635 [Candidatus Thiomargarita nelsonii]|uniref:Uncharacterized protein n=1 Tax=Candidatus Thiomargarita nelsonii TaxID=1003181 RepID=A0A0A6P644_9GAMM|nr:hypothetical protein PN36_16635 [Candidatus Thiomargarita nelsonii]